MVYRYLYDKVPNSKFILTVRSSPEKWLNSCRKHCRNYGMQYPFKQVYGHQSPEGHEQEYLAAYATHNREVEEFFVDKQDRFLKICFEDPDAHAKLVSFLGTKVEDVNRIWSNVGTGGRVAGSRLFKARSVLVYDTRCMLASLNLPMR